MKNFKIQFFLEIRAEKEGGKDVSFNVHIVYTTVNILKIGVIGVLVFNIKRGIEAWKENGVDLKFPGVIHTLCCAPLTLLYLYLRQRIRERLATQQ